MSDSGQMPWSTNPNAPQIPYDLYQWEKGYIAGTVIGAILYGIVVDLFFRCMVALLNPVNHIRGGFKWGLVAHTTAMFTFITIPVILDFNRRSISYIDNREYPTGPKGYQDSISLRAIDVFSGTMFPLNQWLADGLLLYRCCIIYSMNKWIITFPCLVYLAALVTGILFVQPKYYPSNPITIAYYSLSLGLNVLLTLMIVARLILHRRNIRKAMGSAAGATGLYTAVMTVLVESSALYAVTFLLFIALWAANNYIAAVFAMVLGEIQVISPFLIILRVANRRALTSGTITAGSMQFKTQCSESDGSRTLPGDGEEHLHAGASGETLAGPGVGVERVSSRI